MPRTHGCPSVNKTGYRRVDGKRVPAWSRCWCEHRVSTAAVRSLSPCGRGLGRGVRFLDMTPLPETSLCSSPTSPTRGEVKSERRGSIRFAKAHFYFPATSTARVIDESCRPEIRGRRECRALGSPAASGAIKKAHRVSHRELRRSVPAFPARQGFNGLFHALPGEPGLLSPSPVRLRSNRHQLDASVGASGPHDFAVREKRIRRLRCPRPPHLPPHV